MSSILHVSFTSSPFQNGFCPLQILPSDFCYSHKKFSKLLNPIYVFQAHLISLFSSYNQCSPFSPFSLGFPGMTSQFASYFLVTLPPFALLTHPFLLPFKYCSHSKLIPKVPFSSQSIPSPSDPILSTA